MKRARAAVLALTVFACGQSPTGVPARSPRELYADAQTARWVTVLELAPVPVAFVPSIRQGFGLDFEACGIVPHNERRIVYDSPCIERVPEAYIPWMAAHEVAHIYYGDWTRDGSCELEVRADTLATQLSGIALRSQAKCYPAGAAGPFLLQ